MSRKSNETGLSAGQKKTVKLKAFYSGVEESLPPDSIISLDAEEADRLIGLKAAVEYTDDAAPEGDDTEGEIEA